MKKYFRLGFIAVILLFVGKVWATQPDPYKTICHHTPANEVTLNFQNVQSYNGHLGTPHSGSTYDTDGACEEPSVTPSPSPTPCDEDCEPSVTPSPTASPTPTPELTPTPTPVVTPTFNAGSDGKSDGRSDGRSSCPECTAYPKSSFDSSMVGWK